MVNAQKSIEYLYQSALPSATAHVFARLFRNTLVYDPRCRPATEKRADAQIISMGITPLAHPIERCMHFPHPGCHFVQDVRQLSVRAAPCSSTSNLD